MNRWTIAVGCSLMAMTPALAQDQPALPQGVHFVNADTPTSRQISRCFRGLEGPSRTFRMHCTLDAAGVPRQCSASGLGDAESVTVNPRLDCIAAQFRWRRSDDGPTEGLQIYNTIRYVDWRDS